RHPPSAILYLKLRPTPRCHARWPVGNPGVCARHCSGGAFTFTNASGLLSSSELRLL
ncbi:unnamed protein product, partial [Urochloa humidicola]